jgi:tetratricopeptide (TPR) repeat protein
VALLQIGKLYISSGDNQRAHEALSVAVEENPSNAEAYFFLGQVFELQKDGELERAREAYEESLSIDPYFSDAYVSLGRVYGRLDDIQGLHSLTRKIDELELPPDERYVGYLVIGAAYREGNFPGWAKEAYEKAINLNPDRVEAYRELGYVLSYERRWSSAIYAFESALRVASEADESDLHANIGYCYFMQTKDRPLGDTFRQENENKAEQLYRQAIEQDPHRDTGYHLLSELFEAQDRWDEAIKVYKEMATNVQYMTSSANLNIATIHRRLGRQEEMKKALQTAIQCGLEPNSPEYLNLIRRRGLAHFIGGEYQQAEEYLNQAIDKNAYDYQAHFYHALNLLCMNNKDEAWKELENGIGLAKDESAFRYVIEEARVLADKEPEIPGIKDMLAKLIKARDTIKIV